MRQSAPALFLSAVFTAPLVVKDIRLDRQAKKVHGKVYRFGAPGNTAEYSAFVLRKIRQEIPPHFAGTFFIYTESF